MSLPPIAKIDRDHIVAHCQDIVPFLRKEHLFVTGGTGFLGLWLLEGLIGLTEEFSLDLRVTVLTRSPDVFREKAPHLADHPNVETIFGDAKSFIFPENKTFGAIIHAATDTVIGADPVASSDRLKTIVHGTWHTLDFAQAKKVRYFLNVSSGAVYGRQPPELSHIPESYIGAPNALDASVSYGEGKRLAEHLGALYGTNELSVTTARCFAFMGPHLPLNQHFAAGNFLRDVLSNKPITIRGDGTTRRSYLYAADAVIWLLHVLYKGRAGVAYNVGSDLDLSILELAQITAEALSIKQRIEIKCSSVSGTLPERYVPSVERAKRELGLLVGTSLQEQIRRTAEWIERAGLLI